MLDVRGEDAERRSRATPAATAPQPSSRSPARTRPDPERRRRRCRRTTATTIDRAVNGGMATERGETPSTTPHTRRADRQVRRAGRRAGLPQVLMQLRPPRRVPGAARTFRGVPDGEDQDVGADEEDDETLDDQREVAARARARSTFEVEPVRRPVEEAAEEQRSEPDADRGVPAEQRDGDAEEADAVTGTSSWPKWNCSRACPARRRGRRTRRRSPSRGRSSCATLMPPYAAASGLNPTARTS